MNIVTICEPDDWVETHLNRFLWFVNKNVPTAEVHLLMPYAPAQLDRAQEYLKKLKPHFKQIKFIKKEPIEGRLLYYDRLRAYSLDALGLSEAMYIDVDSDVLVDVSIVQKFAPDADLLYTPNIASPECVNDALKLFGFDTKQPQMEQAVIYMRKSLSRHFDRIMESGKIPRNTWVPGSGVWNVVMRQTEKRHMLPYSYNTAPFQCKHVRDAKIVHYAGWHKGNRKYYDYTNWPASVTLQLGREVDPCQAIVF
jgi:hypothetical protein